MLSLLLSACGAGSTDAGPTGRVALSPRAHLVRASMALKGTRPSLEELQRVHEDPAQIEPIVREYVDSPLFGETVMDIENESLLVRTEAHYISGDSVSGINTEDLETAMFQEPLWLIHDVVMGNRAYAEIVTTDQTMATLHTPLIWEGVSSDYDPEGEPWQPAWHTDGRPAAGILSTSGWNRRYISGKTNAHREAANAASSALLCVTFIDREVELGDININDEEAIYNAILSEPACVNCHQSLDPLAGFFFGFAQAGIGLDFPISAWNPETVDDGHETTGRPTGYFGLGGETLDELGRFIVADPRFSACTARRYAAWFSQVPRDEIPMEAVTAWQGALVDSGMSIKEMSVAIVLSDEFSVSYTDDAEDAESVNGLLKTRPGQMHRMMDDLIGFTWEASLPSSGEDPYRSPLALNSQAGFLTLWGGIDSAVKLTPDFSYSATSAATLRSFAAEAAGYAVSTDFARDPTDRDLLRLVEPSTTDEAVLRDQLAWLHQRVLAEFVESDSQEVTQSLRLFNQALALSDNGTTAWKIVLTAFFQDFRVAYH